MRNNNVVYYTYNDKINKLYGNEIKVSTLLNELKNKAKKDIILLHTNNNYKTDIYKLFDTINNTQPTSEKDIPSHIREMYYLIDRDVNHSKYNLLKFKFKLLMNVTYKYTFSYKRLTKYKTMIIPYSTFNFLNTNINNEMAKSIIKSYSFSMGFGNIDLGCIKVQEYERRFDEDGTPSDKSVNWVESNTFKEELIKKNIKPYDKINEPNGRKWFIYHTEPFVYYINWCISMYSYKNVKFFKFCPATFINTKNRLMGDVLDVVGVTIEDIINNPKIGFANKLNYVLKHDPSYALKYKV